MAKKYAIGIDLGGTAIKYGICSEDGELLDQDSVDSPADAPKEKILEALAKLVEKALKSAQQQGIKISAIGLGTPGSVDVERGFLMGSTPNFKHWKNAAISEYLQSRFSLPAFADNDANVMAYGEFSFGAGKEADNVVCVTLGTGIGGGIIIDGELYRGSHYSGAEIGHMTIVFDGRACNCGGTGCWEQYASASAMVKDYNRENHDNQVGDSREIFDRYHEGEKAAEKVIKQITEYIGAGISNILNIFNPEMVIIGGGISEAGDWFIEGIRKSAFRRAMEASQKDVEIKAASLGNRAGLLGAAAFALKRAEMKKASA